MTRQFSHSDEMRARAHAIIPGGAHTYAKGDDQYPVLAPGFIERGEGCRVWDVDGNSFIEYGMGNRAVSLGHAHPGVIEAARQAMHDGANFTRPHRIEVDCAELFLDTIAQAEMVKFCKDGSDATSAAVRLARAHTGRDMIARCADHPFFSTDDWFIGTTAMNAGIPMATRRLTTTFRYGDLESLRDMFARHPGQIAAIIMEAARDEDPPFHYLRQVRDVCHQHGALFILDEMITGFRWHLGGAQELYGVVPDLSCFGKALGNGFSVSALAGKREFMRLGGLDHTDRPRVFLLSTTHGAETHALAAAMATIRVYRDEGVIEHLHRQGRRLRRSVEALAAAHGLDGHFFMVGRDSCLTYATLDRDGMASQAFRTLFIQELIARGVLAPSFVVSQAHDDDAVDATLEAIDGALEIYARALEDGVERHLVGRPSRPVMRRFNQEGEDPPGLGLAVAP